MRPDWEAVITPVVDYALTRGEIDAGKIVLFGYSLGGYLVARAAAFEHLRDGFRAALTHTDGPVVVDVLVDRYALSRPAHVPAKAAAGFTLSLAKQALTGNLEDVIAIAERNVRLL